MTTRSTPTHSHIDEIWEYIANDSVDAADRAIETIFEHIARLAAAPQHGNRRPDLTSAPLLFWNVYSYLIFYAPAERPLWLIAVIHGQHSPRVMAAHPARASVKKRASACRRPVTSRGI